MPGPGRVSRRALGAAAGVLVLISAATLALLYPRSEARGATPKPVAAGVDSRTIGQDPFMADFATPIGRRRVIDLPDRSRIQLNTNTRLHVEYSAAGRRVTMVRGEALFAVAKDPARPFTVKVEDYELSAVGAVFDLCADQACGLRLMVTEGHVRAHRALSEELQQNWGVIATPESARNVPDVVVEENKALSMGAGTERMDVLTPDQLAAATAWQRGKLVFKATPLAQVVKEVARYSSVRWVLSKKALADLPVSGSFDIGDIDGLAAALAQSAGVKITRQHGYVLLSASQSAR